MDRLVEPQSIPASTETPGISGVEPDAEPKARPAWAVAALALLGAAALGVIAWRQGWIFPGTAPTTLRLSGNVEAHESVLSFKAVQSRIVELPFDEGASIKQGTVIARVDDSDYRQQVVIGEANVAVQQRQLDAAERNRDAAQKVVLSDQADLEYKTVDFDRIDKLAEQGYMSKDSRDLAAAALKESRAALERDRALREAADRNVQLARANIRNATEALQLARITESYTILRAPIDGVILVRQAELGEVVSPGTPIFTLADIDHVWLRAYVNERDVGRIRFGEHAVVTTDNYPDKRYRGRVSFIAEQAEFTPKSVETHAERVTLVYRVRIDVDNPTHELVPGMPADAELQLLR
jgi:HlyD family secretion protein